MAGQFKIQVGGPGAASFSFKSLNNGEQLPNAPGFAAEFCVAEHDAAAAARDAAALDIEESEGAAHASARAGNLPLDVSTPSSITLDAPSPTPWQACAGHSDTTGAQVHGAPRYDEHYAPYSYAQHQEMACYPQLYAYAANSAACGGYWTQPAPLSYVGAASSCNPVMMGVPVQGQPMGAVCPQGGWMNMGDGSAGGGGPMPCVYLRAGERSVVQEIPPNVHWPTREHR